jgi:C-terminal processing protease CtpA/Prc
MLSSLARIAVLVPLIPAAALPAQSPAEKRSFVELESVTPEQSANLALLGKVWGFLKYHHPRVARGELDWDAELFSVLPLVLDAGDRAAGNAALVAWCKEVGEPEPCSPCAQEVASAHLQPRSDWIRDEARLGAELSGFLQRVHANRPSGERQHYIDFVRGVGNPIFANEESYPDAPVSDAGFRLLALFRFWNMIESWFPYRDQIEEDWDAVLEEFVPRLAAAQDQEAYGLAMMALIARVHDTHCNLWSSLDLRPPRGAAQLPVIARFVEGRATVIGPMGPQPTGELRRGDVILALDGHPVADLLAQWRPFYADSNEAAWLRDVGELLTRGPVGKLKLRIERDGRELELEETRLPLSQLGADSPRLHDLPGATFRLLSPEVAYVKLSSIRVAQIPELLSAAEGTRGLVIDIRNYPSEFVVFALGQHLISEPTPFARFTQGVAANPGTFVWGAEVKLQPAAPRYGGRVAILVDETSQSQAEYTSMAFRASPGSVVVGSMTAGADGNVSRIPLPCGLQTMISGIGVFWPDERPTQRVGIVPDIEVQPTLAGVREGRDEVLEAALQALLGEATTKDEVRRIAGEALKG